MTWSFDWLGADGAGLGAATGVWIAGAGTVELDESSFERYPKSSCDYVEFLAEFFCLNFPSRGQYEGVSADSYPVAGALYEFAVSDFYSYACDLVFQVSVDSYDFAEGSPVWVL